MGAVGFSWFDGVPPSVNVEVVSTFLARTDATMLDSVARENQREIGRRSVGRIESMEVVLSGANHASPPATEFRFSR